MGHRVGKTIGTMETVDTLDPLTRLREQTIRPETRIQYTIDLTRNYHNLLQKEEAGITQNFLWDGNVAGMTEDENEHEKYYFQDEMGSPIRLMGKNGELEESYGYDEFGQDLYENQGIVQPFGYTGYQADRVTGTYYAQAREYMASNGRFISKDQDKFYKIVMPLSWNLYTYCASNSLRFIDPQGTDWKDMFAKYMEDGWDNYGLELGLHWLYGKGKDMNIYSDSTVPFGGNRWQTYMQDNAILTGKVGDIVIPIGESLENGESISVNMNISMVINNGEGAVGYMFLHGTNADVGGFQISGNISKDNKGDTRYDLIYTWNDIMDPNFLYQSDVEKAELAQSIPGADPTDYDFHLSWHEKTIMRENPNFILKNTGWLKNYSSDWKYQLSKGDMIMLAMIDNQQTDSGALSWSDQLQEIYKTYFYYYDCEVLN